MARKQIFIASATESQKLASTIAQRLSASERYTPLRWWTEFGQSQFTLETLEEIAGCVDGAVFVCVGTDQTWYRGRERSQPRDNVIFEYGLFLARLGRARTLVIRDANVSLPSDLEGITHERLGSDQETAAERVVEFFDKVFVSKPPLPVDVLPLAVDATVVDKIIAPRTPATWRQRCLYLGAEGARGWLAAIEDPEYYPQPHRNNVKTALLRAAQSVDVRTFVSLGPGDAWVDMQLADVLLVREPWLNYVPVDICEGLLERAIAKLGDRAKIPVGILSDFEERPTFIARQLRAHAPSPRLFALLGNTFGNLDLQEVNLAGNLRRIMAAGDYLLLEVCTQGPAWSPEAGRRRSPSSYPAGERRWLATGLARQTDDSIEEIIKNFETRITFGEGVSDVDHTYAKDLKDASNGRIIYTFRRYDVQTLVAWFTGSGFRLVGDVATVPFNDANSDSVILLQRTG